MIKAIGLDRSSAYIANVVPWRPPGNRTPTPQETEICRPFIERQIALADPDFLIFLGGASAKQLLKTNEGILRLRGKWRDYDTGLRERSAPWRRSTPPTCCASPCRRSWRGGTC